MSGTVNGTGVSLENDLSGVGSLSETVAERQPTAALNCDIPDADSVVCSLFGGFVEENGDTWTLGAYFYQSGGSLKLFVVAEFIEFSVLGEVSSYKSDVVTVSDGLKTDCDAIAESGSATRCFGTVGPGSAGWAVAVA